MLNHILKRTHWIFDLDGTLTRPIHNFDEIRRALGLPEKADILSCLAALPPEQAKVSQEKLDKIEVELAHKTQPAPGVKSFLQQLVNRGCKLGILTRNTSNNARLSLEIIGVRSLFEDHAILGREESKPKPDPDGILTLAAVWNIQPEQIVMVGDYLYDLQAGRRAEAATIHVDSSKLFPWQQWMDIGVSSLEELGVLMTDF